ncbi:GDSL esterase/lipase EXL3-like [Oryza brachyantha]|uniref:GDSL esterase/lipase EXL3-like n=1 Tax=Oryza brachyantha TaxID=4533 RepID=UPI001ADA50E6|nr:GDSL esterase/lipase EXL3-like [Oryza brachyantha]
MAAAVSVSVILFLSALAGGGAVEALLGAPPSPGAAAKAKVAAVLAFGDSVVDTGNNNYIRTIIRSNFPPYGKDFPGGKATGRFSDGKISVDFLASALGVKEMLPPYLDKKLTMDDLRTGVSFASAGSGYDNATCRTMMTGLTVERQLQLFAEYKAKLGGAMPERALYLLCWGTNDVVQHFTLGDGKTEPQYADFMAQRAVGAVQTLVGHGARLILVVGAPPVGCVPAQRIIAGGVRRQCATDRNQVALLYNRKLSQEINRLNGQLAGVKIIYVDLYSILTDVMHGYQALGFKNGKDACCGYIGLAASVLCNFASPLCDVPSDYVFWDSYHPTERAYKLMVDQVVHRYLRFL